jgi:hypothetical protein
MWRKDAKMDGNGEMGRVREIAIVGDIAEAARTLGWKRGPLDHYDIGRMIFQQAGGLMKVGGGILPRWLHHAYVQELDNFPPGLSGGPDEFVYPGPDEDVEGLALSLPSWWLPAFAVAADDRRKKGRAEAVLRALIRIQESMRRHSIEPIGRASRVRDVVRAREVFLLAREEELEREIVCSLLFLPWGGSGSPARATSGAGDASAMGASDSVSGSGPDFGGWYESS